MNIKVEINKKQLDDFNIKTSNLLQATTNRRFLSAVGAIVSAQSKMNIHEGSADGNNSYKLLAPSTLKQKLKNNYSAKPLERSGELKGGVNYSIRNGELFITMESYGKYHQYGTSKMPARPIVNIRPITMLSILDELKKTMIA